MNSKSLSNRAFGSKAKLAMICLIALLGFGLSSVGCRKNASNPSLNFAPVPDGLPQNSYADLVGKVAPAVITIRANKRVRNPQQFDFSNNPFFRDLFGDRGQQQPPQESLERALGSGVIVSTDGYVLTNHHVIDGAQDIKVDLNDGRTFDAKLIGSDPPSDLALLKVEASGLTFMTPGDSDKVRVGDVALAIGSHSLAVVPFDKALSSRSAPPDCCARPNTIDKPKPVPLPIPFVEKNGSTALARVSGSIPSPVSRTESTT